VQPEGDAEEARPQRDRPLLPVDGHGRRARSRSWQLGWGVEPCAPSSAWSRAVARSGVQRLVSAVARVCVCVRWCRGDLATRARQSFCGLPVDGRAGPTMPPLRAAAGPPRAPSRPERARWPGPRFFPLPPPGSSTHTNRSSPTPIPLATPSAVPIHHHQQPRQPA
jgi:hypothetical protein